MSRSRLPFAVLLITSSAVAAPARRVTVDVPPAAAAAASISHTIVLDRCSGNCTVNKGSPSNALQMTSMIPQGVGPFTIHEFANTAGEKGAAADAEWAQVLTCVREVYSPFDVQVTDQRPADGSTFHLAIVAGTPQDAGLPADILGIAPLASDCSAQDNTISFTFAAAHPAADRVFNLCWTIAQESAHAFGLDHEFMFLDGKSACTDPMTYRTDCGGQRFFRNKGAQCGTFAAASECKCKNPSQNSHQMLLDVFGPGTPSTPPPSAQILFPQPNAASLGAVVSARAGSQRGVAKVELFVNGFVWVTLPGKTVGPSGQPNPSDYTIDVPADLPHSIVDLVVRATDDLGAFTDSPQITVTNGEPCVDASVCAEFQHCDPTGRCLWDPPVGELGDDCTYSQFCKSGQCVATTAGRLCSEACVPDSDSCPSGLVCAQASPGAGLCLPAGGAGCCQTGRDPASPWLHAGFAALVLGLAGRRRRSRSRSVG